MTIESNLKTIIGDQAFQICSLVARVEDLTEENKKLKEEKNDTSKPE